VKKRLRSTRLRARASADERPDLAAAAVFGEVTLTALNLSSEPGIAGPFGSLVDLVDPRLTALGARCVLPLATAREALAKAGLADAGIEGCDHLRVSLGIPDGSRDLMQHSARRHSRLP
jgi:hypothetical protein